LEKSSLLRTGADVDAARGAIIEPLDGEDPGPIEGFLRAGDFKKVLIGDFERGGGNRTPDARFRSAITSAGFGIVPAQKLIT
jgi:hypothetical protein